MSTPLALFEAYGIELEYMIVDNETLNIRPLSDEILKNAKGEIESELEYDEEVSWSNELVLHVIEIKTNGPKPKIENLAEGFQKSIKKINSILNDYGACLLPTGMHPWMNPYVETKLWPHDYNVVYEKFNRIFDCRGHGWSNLQSTHLNLPFSNDEEFSLLHEAIRLLLPILPAITASSPIAEGKSSGYLDYRLEVYRSNCSKIPSISGEIIPERICSKDEYLNKILKPIYEDLKPYDPERDLQHEWVNARGAIARFERQAIEIRTMDVQECPQADLAICFGVSEILKHLVEKLKLDPPKTYPETSLLKELLLGSIKKGKEQYLDSRYEAYCNFLGIAYFEKIKVEEIWWHLAENIVFAKSAAPDILTRNFSLILETGSLSQRILRRLKSENSKAAIHSVYSDLRDCLAQGVSLPC